MKRIPIKAAKDIGLAYGQDQVILITYSKKGHMISVVPSRIKKKKIQPYG